VSASGAPTGAGNLGLIPHKGKHGGAKAADASGSQPAAPGTPPAPGPGSGPGAGPGSTLQGGEDPDHDGIPTAFDADATGAGEPNQENAQASQGGAGGGIFTQLGTAIASSVNLDAGAFSSEEMTQFIHKALGLDLGLQDPALGTIKSVSVNCGTLIYCATAAVAADTGNVPPHGSVWNGEVPPGNSPGILDRRGHRRGGRIQPTDDHLPGEPGRLRLSAEPVMLNGDSLNLSSWRPQRAAFPGEGGFYVDMGHLHYGVGIAVPSGTDNCLRERGPSRRSGRLQLARSLGRQRS
jgi:hypothetical protein